VYQRPGSYYGASFGFPMTPMVRNLLVANVMVWLMQDVLFPTWTFALSVPGVFEKGYIWQPFTYMWLHGPTLHIVFNMLSLWMFGPQLENEWGSQRFLRFYIACGVGAGVVILLGNAFLLGVDDPTLGASGAIFGLLTAFSLIWPDRTIMLLFPPIPLRALYFIPFLFLMTLAIPGGSNISHVGHLGGVITAGILMRDRLMSVLNLTSLRYRWHRYRMRGRLRAIQREEWERRRKSRDDGGPTLH
jgi:membrane associated rhomboid family serine protease